MDGDTYDADTVAEESDVGVVELALLLQDRVQVAEVPAATRVLDRDRGGVRAAVCIEVAEGPLGQANHDLAGRAGRDRLPELTVLECGPACLGVLGLNGGRLEGHCVRRCPVVVWHAVA